LRLRLAYLINEYPAGSHTFIRREIRELEAKGHEVRRFSIRLPAAALVDESDLDEKKRTHYLLDDGGVALFNSVLRHLIRRPFALIRACALAARYASPRRAGLVRACAYLAECCHLHWILQKHGITHVHAHFGTNPATVAHLLARLGGSTFSITIHGSGEFDVAEQLDLRGKIADARFVVAISDFCAAQLMRWARIADVTKIRVIHCGVDRDFLDFARPIHSDCQLLVSVGRLSAEKGNLLLLDAFSSIADEFPDARLQLVGDGPLRRLVEDRAAVLGLEHRVNVTGWLAGPAVREAILASRALVVSSFAEGLPLAIVEALALGRPVIAPWIAGIPELIRSGENGWLVPPANITRLAGAMRTALSTPISELSEMAGRGRRQVAQEYDVVKETEKLVEVFTEHAVTSWRER
jgi:glycosyltransferase involved in cell wall biosynthesis